MARKLFLGFSLCLLFFIFILEPDQKDTEILPQEEIQRRTVNKDDSYIEIGFYASLTGSASQLGQMGQQGCRLAVEQINNAGGINGKKIRVIEYDDQTDPAVAVSIVRKMIEDDHVDAIIGSHTSGNIVRTVPLTEQAQVLQMGLGTSYIWTDAGYQYLFRASGNSRDYDDAIFTSIKEAGYKKIAIYYCSTEYGRAGANTLMARIQQDPAMELVWSRSNDITQTDFKSDFLSLEASGSDALILYATSENAGTQLRQLRESCHYKGAVYGPEAFANSTTRQEAGNSIWGVTYACTNSIPESPVQAVSEKERAFLEQFIKMYGTMPTAETAYRGYDAMMILAEVFRNAKSMNSSDLRQAILGITDYVGVNGTFDFSDGSGDGLSGCQVVTVLDANSTEIQEYHRP